MATFDKFLTSIVLILCCTTAGAQSISFDSDTMIRKTDDKQIIPLKAKDTFVLKPGDSILAQNKIGFPILIFAAQSAKTNIVVSDADLEAALQAQMQPELEKRTAEIVDNIRKVENLIQKRDYNQASSAVLNLKSKYKNISSILFLSGTVHYLTNNNSAAIEDLQNGLNIDPNNSAAKRLLDQLRGVK